MSLNTRISEMLEALNIRQSQFARDVNVSTGNVTDWVKGKSQPSAGALAKMAEHYRVNINWLLTGAGEMFIDSYKIKLGPSSRVSEVSQPLTTDDLIDLHELQKLVLDIDRRLRLLEQKSQTK